MVQNAAKLPSEFVLDLDFEDIELVEKGIARPLVPVTALIVTWMCFVLLEKPFPYADGWVMASRKLGGSESRWTSSRHESPAP